MIELCMGLAEGKSTSRVFFFPSVDRRVIVVFTIRTWAVAGGGRRLGIFLAAFFIALWVPGCTLTVIWFPTLIRTCVSFWINFVVIVTPHCGYRFMCIASPIPVPTQIISSGCSNIITSSVRSVNYVLILPFYIGQFSVYSLEFYLYGSSAPV